MRWLMLVVLLSSCVPGPSRSVAQPSPGADFVSLLEGPWLLRVRGEEQPNVMGVPSDSGVTLLDPDRPDLGPFARFTPAANGRRFELRFPSTHGPGWGRASLYCPADEASWVTCESDRPLEWHVDSPVTIYWRSVADSVELLRLVRPVRGVF